MTLLELVAQAGLQPIREASTGGGEYGCACLACGGTDRFRVWPNQGKSGRFWCRRCNIHGDSVDFCNLFLGLSMAESLKYVGAFSTRPFVSKQSSTPPPLSNDWVIKAELFTEACHQRLMIDHEILAFIRCKYGLLPDIIRFFRVGWNQTIRFDRRLAWGLSEEGEKKHLCLPQGITIPYFRAGVIAKLKIRRTEEESRYWQKYYEIPGSLQYMPIYGFLCNQNVVVVESELDGMTLCQEIGEFCTCLTTGGAGKRPEPETMEWLKSKKLVLYAQDFDDTGREHFRWWKTHFHNVRAWPSEMGKSPADSFVLHGVDLRAWWHVGIKRYEEL